MSGYLHVYFIGHWYKLIWFYTGKSEDGYLAPSPLKGKPDYENKKDVETYENPVVMDPEDVYEVPESEYNFSHFSVYWK